MKLVEVMKEIAEQSAGIIVYRVNSEGIIEFLLLNGDAIGWGFPKGHVDKGEDLTVSAVAQGRNAAQAIHKSIF